MKKIANTRIPRPSRRRACMLIAAACTMGWLGHATAAGIDKPVRFIVPYTAGGATDIAARTLANHMAKRLGQSVVVENRPGASGNIGMAAAARSPADGSTIVMASAGQTIAASYFQELNYDLKADFAPVAKAVENQRMLVGREDAPFSNLEELIVYAKSNPGKLSYATFGAGSSAHLAAELFAQQAGVEMLHVPYKGNSDAVNALLGGQVDVMFSELSSVIAQVNAGKLKAYGIGSKKRFSGVPEIPTIDESGLPGFEVSGWLGVLAPKGTPAEVVQELNAAIVETLQLPEVREQMTQIGAEITTGPPASFNEFIEQDVAKWEKVLRAANLYKKG